VNLHGERFGLDLALVEAVRLARIRIGAPAFLA
jgi:hypothetical protein